MAERWRAPRRPTPYEDGRSWSGAAMSMVGAVIGAVCSLGALIFGLYALAYAEHDIWLGGYNYGCDGQACAAAHTSIALICFGSVVVYVTLVVVALRTSVRMLRAGTRLGLAWATVVLVISIVGGWQGLALLAISPALMGIGSRMRLRAKQRRQRKWSGRTASSRG